VLQARLGRALPAQTVDLEPVAARLEAVGAADLDLQSGDPRALKLHHPLTAGADQMIVLLPGVHVLEEKAALAQTMLANHSGAHQELKTAVDGGARDGDAAAAQRAVQIVRVEVPMVGEDLFEKGLALAGHPHPALADKLKEALVFTLERHGRSLY
jgi:hypothetical protein